MSVRRRAPPSTLVALAPSLGSLALGLALLVLAGDTAACHRGASSDATPTVTIGYFANLSHAQAVLGVTSGDFARALAPAKLQTQVFNAGPSLIEALLAGAVDIGYVGPGPVISAHVKSGGRAVRVIAGAAANGVVVVARSGSGIRQLGDLAGRRIATPQLANTQDISARHYLATVLKQTNLSNVVPVDNAEQASLLARGQIDAAWVPEPWGQRLITETGATLVAEEKDLWPSKQFSLTVVVTTPEFLAKHADLVESVLRVHRAWTERLTADSDKYMGALSDSLFQLTGKRLPEGVLPAALKRVRFVDDPGIETLTTFAHWRHDLGFDEVAADLTGLVDASALARASLRP